MRRTNGIKTKRAARDEESVFISAVDSHGGSAASTPRLLPPNIYTSFVTVAAYV